MDIIVKYVPQILIGLAAIIPLIAALIKYVGKATESKNWNIVVKMVLDLMVQAEQDYSAGADKKAFVMNQIAVICAWIAIIFCVVRGIPVVVESKKLFEKK